MRGNGEGSVWRYADGRRNPWAAVLVVGWRADGRAIKRTRFAASEREAKVMLAEMVARHRAGLPLPEPSLTVGAWLRRWIEHIRPSVRPATYGAYAGTVERYLVPDLGTVPLLTLSPSRVEAMLARHGRLSANTRAGMRGVLRRSLADALKDGVIVRNAAALARPPKQDRVQRTAPTTAEVRALLAALEGHRLRDLVLVMAATGLRVGEATGLTWDDVAPPVLTVRHQLARLHGEPVLAEPKSARSCRTILLPPSAVAGLSRQQDRQARERFGARSIGRGWDSGLVFTTATGRPLSESTLQYVVAEACRRAGIRHLSPHDLRRFASTVVAATGDMKAAQEMLGHASIAMTADVYVSTTEATRRRAADALEEALG